MSTPIPTAAPNHLKRRLAVASSFLAAAEAALSLGPDLSDLGPRSSWDEDDRFEAASRRAAYDLRAARALAAAAEEVRIAVGLLESHGATEPDRRFYVSAQDSAGDRFVLLAGPFVTHEEALVALPRAVAYTTRHYDAVTASFGTCSTLRAESAEEVVAAVHAYATHQHDDLSRAPD